MMKSAPTEISSERRLVKPRNSVRNRLQTSPAKEGHQEMQKNGVTCRNGAAHQMPADQKVIRQELTTTSTVGNIGFSGRRKAEAKPSGQPKIIIREGELRPGGNSSEPVGGTSLPEAKEVR